MRLLNFVRGRSDVATVIDRCVAYHQADGLFVPLLDIIKKFSLSKKEVYSPPYPGLHF